MHRSPTEHGALRALVTLLLLGSLSVVSTGCQEAFTGPSIDSANVEPSELPVKDTRMTDECFTVTMQVSGFQSEIDEIRVFLVDHMDRSATATAGDPNCSASANPTFEGTPPTITVHGILKSIVEGLGPGDYPIGAEIFTSDGGSVTQRGIATITVTES